jgi:hypothetical protein
MVRRPGLKYKKGKGGIEQRQPNQHLAEGHHQVRRRGGGSITESGGRRERRAEVGGGGREGESWLAPWEAAGGEGTALCRRSGRDLRRSLRERREATDLR